MRNYGKQVSQGPGTPKTLGKLWELRLFSIKCSREELKPHLFWEGGTI